MSAQPLPAPRPEPTCASCGKPLGHGVWLERTERGLVHTSCTHPRPVVKPLIWEEDYR